MSHSARKEGKHPLDLGAIKAPRAPSKEPDERTREEEEHLEDARQVASLKPAERHMYAVERMVRHLEGENAGLASARDNLQSQLDDLRPRYSALQQAKKNVTGASVLGTISLTAGGAALSWAGMLLTDVSRYYMTGGGLALVVLGSLLLLLMYLWGWPKDD